MLVAVPSNKDALQPNHTPSYKHPLYIQTPLISSTVLERRVHIPVYLKLETLQPSGSFKNRGIGNVCYRSMKKGIRKFISASGGNAGLAVAYSGRKLNIPVTVVIPSSTPSFMKEKIQEEKAEVIVHGSNLDEAVQHAKSLVTNKQTLYISPYDNPLIWDGHASLVHEIYQTGQKPGIILLSVGGGGLLCGILKGLHDVGWDDVPVMALETEGAASFAASIKAGKVVSLDKIQTIATSLGLKRVTDEAFLWTKRHKIYSRVVSDKDTLLSCLNLLDDHKILVEPACGVAFVPLYQNDPFLKQFSSALVIVCGGNVVNLSLLEKWKKELL